MEGSEDTMSSDDAHFNDSGSGAKRKPKKRSLIERELETSLTPQFVSPVSSDGQSTSRYGRARRLKTDNEFCDTDKAVANALKSPHFQAKTPVKQKSPAYKMHALNSPVRSEANYSLDSKSDRKNMEDHIENICNSNMSLSRFGPENKKISPSPIKKFYIRKDLIQSKEKDDPIMLIKNMFSPTSDQKTTYTVKSSEKKTNKFSEQNGHMSTSSVVKTLDFDGKKKNKEQESNIILDLDGKKKKKGEKDKIVLNFDSKKKNKGEENKKMLAFHGKKTKKEQDGQIMLNFDGKKTNKEAEGKITLDFDTKKKKKEVESRIILSKSELFELEAQCGFQVGDVAWARMGTFPFWPCIVTREPGSDMFVKKKLFGRIEHNMIHVTFFGDNGRRSWILDSMLRTYQGRAEFESAREQFTPEAKKKDPRLYAAFFISEKKQPLWNSSVDEAESLFKEPKRLRIDLLYEMLEKSRINKHTPKGTGQKSGKISRTDSDVSLSESLYDSLFSEDDLKSDDTDKKTKTKRKSLDVSEVVTACLDNMAAKTGMTVIQKQSHMDRWLQKAKSKTPEKLQVNISVAIESIDTNKKDVFDKVKENKGDSKKKKKDFDKVVSTKKRYSLRRSVGESQILLSHHNEHDYSKLDAKVPGVLETVTYDQGDKADISITQVDEGSTETSKEFVPNQNDNIEDDKVEENKELNNLLIEDNNKMDVDVTILENGEDDKVEKNKELNNLLIEDNNKMDVDVTILENGEAIHIEITDELAENHENSNKIDNDTEIQTEIDKITENNDNYSQIGNQNGEVNVQPDNVKNNDKILMVDSSVASLENSESKLTDVISNDETPDDLAVESNVAVVKDIHIQENENHITENNLSIDNTDLNEPCDDKINESLAKETKNHDNNIISNGNHDVNAKTNEELISNSDSEFELLYEVSPLKAQEETALEATKINAIPFNLEVNDESNNKIGNVEDQSEKVDVVKEADEIELKQNNDEIPENKDEENYCKQLRICLTPLKSDVMNGHVEAIKINDIPLNMEVEDESYNKSNKVENENKEISKIVQDTSQKAENCDESTENINVENKSKQLRICLTPLKSDIEATKTTAIPLNMEFENESYNKNIQVENENEEITKTFEDNLKAKNSDEFPENNSKQLKICLTPLKNEVVNEHLSKSATPISLKESSSVESYVNGIEDTMLCKSETSNTEINNHEDRIDIICNSTSDNINISENSEIMDNVPIPTTVANTETGITTNIPGIIENINANDDKLEIIPNKNNHVKVLENLSEETNITGEKNVDEVDSSIKVNDIVSNSDNKDEMTDLNLAVTDDMLKAMKTFEGLMTEFDSETTSVTSGIDDVSSPIKMPVEILHGLRESEAFQRIKHDLFVDSDTESASSELDNINLKDLKATLSKNSETNDESSKSNENKAASDSVNVSEAESGLQTKWIKNCRKLSLRIRRSQSPTDSVKMNGFRDSKESSPDRKMENEKDLDTISINSEDSTASSTKRKGRKGKQKEEEDRSKDPEFLRYLEMRQDNLMDEHPELTYEEIVAYLYKTWLYEENLKPDIKKSDDIDQMTLVKGANEDLQPKKAKKKSDKRKKLIDISRVMNKEVIDVDALPKDKPKRKAVQSCYYREDFSDIEEEIQLFEIFKKKKPEENQEQGESSKALETIKSPKAAKPVTEVITIEDDLPPEEEYYDDEEKYFEEMTKPKPNVFKGLVREKVCEVCEKTSNLIKCKGCSGMFHLDCAKKEPEIVEVAGPTRGRKKKKKPRGRKPKSMDGLDESHSDENDINNSIDEIKEPELIVIDADKFEAEFQVKMKELLENPECIDYDCYYSDNGINWTESVAGKCEIVDVKLKPKHVETDYSDFKCINCQKDEIPICFVCKSAVSPKTQNTARQRCQVAHCCRYYHLECLEQWPQTQFNAGDIKNNKKDGQEPLTCPRHVCHTCVSDDPRGCKTRFSGDKLARCVRCPATYHTFTKCLPAGSQILTASHIICPRHYEHRPGKVPCHVNTGWCFICALGGTLICCEYCPTSFHAECLGIEPPAGGYMCEDCETGRLPLYGEMVWVKLGHYRWWPGLVLHPSEIPTNILAVKHSLGEFVVRFFGQYDHYWVNRGRVFPFQEGDSGRISSQKSKIDEAFTKAIEHAQRAFEILKNTEPNQEESLDIASSLLPPHYVKLKVNKPCGSVIGRKVECEESSLTQCECRPEEEDPCGPHSQCLNRMLLTECGPICRTGDRCNNRAFEKRLYPKMVPYRTPHRGWGLKTLEDIRAGQFVIEYVGELIDEEEFRRRMRRKHEIRDENYYFLTLDKERMIDAGPKGNLARFMNHCCEPNCETQKWTVLGDVRVGLFAIKDIPANTEVTFNYNLECAGIEKKRCLCGAKRCSGYMGAKPKQDEPQPKKLKIAPKRPYNKKKKPAENSPSTKIKRPVGRPAKPRELTEIEKDLLIIKNATNGLSSDSEGSGRLSSIDDKEKPAKRKRDSIDEPTPSTSNVKKIKTDDLETVPKVVDS